MSILERNPVKRAEEFDCDIVYPADDELFIDADNGKMSIEAVREALEMVNKLHWQHVQPWHAGASLSMTTKARVSKVTESKGGNKHIIITFPRSLSVVERIALQAVFGSDLKRELLSLLHYFQGTLEQPTCFFEPRDKKSWQNLDVFTKKVKGDY